MGGSQSSGSSGHAMISITNLNETNNKTETNSINPYESHTVENYRAMVHEISEIRAELRLLTQEFAQIMQERDERDSKNDTNNLVESNDL